MIRASLALLPAAQAGGREFVHHIIQWFHSKIMMKPAGKLGLIIKHGDVSNVVQCSGESHNNVPNRDYPDFFPNKI